MSKLTGEVAGDEGAAAADFEPDGVLLFSL